MNTNKHTAGPWTYKATASLGPQYAVYPENEGYDIAIVYDHGDAEANARLIASAPALLAENARLMAALKSCVEIALPDAIEAAIANKLPKLVAMLHKIDDDARAALQGGGL